MSNPFAPTEIPGKQSILSGSLDFWVIALIFTAVTVYFGLNSADPQTVLIAAIAGWFCGCEARRR